ncbi:MAG: type III-A CRISPR-associated RAMP protein Csm4 [Thermoplasmataceae archaeon]
MRPFTSADSIKATGALISSYFSIENALGEVFDDSILKKGGIRASSIFPSHNSEKLFPITKLHIILKGIEEKDRKEILKGRKNVPRFLPINVIENIAKNFKDNDYLGISAAIVPDIVKYKTEKGPTENDRLSVNLTNTENPELYTREFDSFSGLNFESGKLTGMRCWFSTSITEKVDPIKFQASIRLLEDFGISGRRTTGSGQFVINSLEKEDGKTYGFNGEGLYLSLSKYIPSAEDMESLVLSKSMYSISNFTGNDSNGHQMGAFRYFNEGSLLYLKKEVHGRSFDLIDIKNRFLPFFPFLRRVS